MCGISGIFSTSNVDSLQERIKKMNDSIIHRGPDFGNFKIFSKNVSLGHRRLSIIDLSDDGNQPMSTKSNIWHIVFS